VVVFIYKIVLVTLCYEYGTECKMSCFNRRSFLHGNESVCSTTGEEFLDQLRKYQQIVWKFLCNFPIPQIVRQFNWTFISHMGVILTCDPFSRYSFPMGKNNLINISLKLSEKLVRIQPSNVSHAELRFLFPHMWRIILSHLCLLQHEIKFLIDKFYVHVTVHRESKVKRETTRCN
jgi:hypothetical protein